MSIGPSHKVVDTSRYIIMNLDSGAHSLKRDTWFKIGQVSGKKRIM